MHRRQRRPKPRKLSAFIDPKWRLFARPELWNIFTFFGGLALFFYGLSGSLTRKDIYVWMFFAATTVGLSFIYQLATAIQELWLDGEKIIFETLSSARKHTKPVKLKG